MRITDVGMKSALDGNGIRLLPASTERSHTITSSMAFGPFEEGDHVTLSLSSASYLKTGDSSTVADTSGVLLPAGVHDFVVPEGVTHVALISTMGGAVAAVWR